MNNFEDISKFLTKDYDLEIILDEKKSISLIVEEKISLQLELDQSLQKLLIFCKIAEITAGKYREDVLTKSLKENFKYPYSLILGFLEKESALCAYNYIYMDNLDEKKFITFFSSFTERALFIQDAIEKGNDF
ncbi:MAG: hypothetical protein A3F40_03750 [Chlamydiae bacterium RIFCSPHIGHO2_12_FULL_27_8]|nr:MAG: hypothetical protein A3F40_03750 [Chlamydiae bacterium RIFCSPHIGHO2_12_FULL_27_8]OGN65198.1 MAG: hypothetical protein A2888_01355 [Chlamydiae bacterium RIFCSPLOWO2_01_FULL_28_7]